MGLIMAITNPAQKLLIQHRQEERRRLNKLSGKRYKKRLARAGKLTPYMAFDVYINSAGKCQICKSEYDLTIDHIIPISRGGKTNGANLQLLCRECNSRKGNKLPEELDDC